MQGKKRTLDTSARADLALAQMRQWRDCKTTQERQAALADAMQLAGGAVSRAAKFLNISRQHLHRILSAGRAAEGGVRRGDTVTSVTPIGGDGAVARTFSAPLTYGASGRTFASTMSTATLPAVDEQVVRVALDLPRSVKERLERDALAAKQSGERARQSQSHVVLKALRRYWDEQDQREARPKRKAARGKDGGE